MKQPHTAVSTESASNAMGDSHSAPLGHRSRTQGGFGTLDMLIALVIGLLAVIAAMAAMSKLTASQNNNDELSNISSLITNTRVLKTSSGYGSTGSDLVRSMINSGGVPDLMERTTTEVFNAWGGTVTILSTGTGFTMTYSDVPKDSCIILASKAAGSRAMSTSINGGAAIVGEVTTAQGDSGCSQDTNTLSWSTR